MGTQSQVDRTFAVPRRPADADRRPMDDPEGNRFVIVRLEQERSGSAPQRSALRQAPASPCSRTRAGADQR